LSTLVEKHRDDLVKTRLDEIHGSGEADSSLDRGLALAQQRSIGHEKW